MHQSQKLNPSLQKQIDQAFTQVLTEIKNTDQSSCFVSGFFTSSEKDIFTKRLAIAYWLKKGRSYENIKQNLKVSSATIASIQQELKKPGWKLALEKVMAEEWASKWEEKIKNLFKRDQSKN